MGTAFDHPEYNYKVVRQFAVTTVFWGIIGDCRRSDRCTAGLACPEL